MSGNSSENTSSEIGRSGIAFNISSENACNRRARLPHQGRVCGQTLDKRLRVHLQHAALSAPSARILTFKSSIFSFSHSFYDGQSFVCRRNPVIAMGRRQFLIGTIEEDGPALIVHFVRDDNESIHYSNPDFFDRFRRRLRSDPT